MDSNTHVNVSENIPHNCAIEITSFNIPSTEMFAITCVICTLLIIKLCSLRQQSHFQQVRTGLALTLGI